MSFVTDVARDILQSEIWGGKIENRLQLKNMEEGNEGQADEPYY